MIGWWAFWRSVMFVLAAMFTAVLATGFIGVANSDDVPVFVRALLPVLAVVLLAAAAVLIVVAIAVAWKATGVMG